MLRLSSYRLATAASIWAMLPWAYAYLITLPFAHHYISEGSVQIAVVACTVVWLLGLFMGRWALGVLKRPEVRQAFIFARPDDRPGSLGHSTMRSIARPAVGLISVGVLALLVGHIFFFLSANDILSSSINRGWLLGPISGSFALLAATGFLIVGGYHMIKLRHYDLAMAAAFWAMVPWPWAFFLPLPFIDVPVDEGLVISAVLATSVVWVLSVFVGSMAARVLKRAEVRSAFTSGLFAPRASSIEYRPAGSPSGELANRPGTNIDYLFVKFSGHHGVVRREAEALILEYFGGIFHSRVTEKAIPFGSIGSIILKERWFGVRLIIRASRLSALKGIPGGHEGEIRLEIRRRDRDAAQQFVAEARRRLADPGLRTPLPTAALAGNEAVPAAVQISPLLSRMASLVRSVRSLVFNSSPKDDSSADK
jgi:hypothetical protein